MDNKPLMIDLYCGLGGWASGGLAEGYRVVGFDIERHHYGDAKYPAQLVLQSVLTLHGKQFKDAALIVASPPCQEFSYMAMPWSLAKEKQARIEASTDERKRLTALFDACFRIQREACEAAGRYIPLIVENVRGAQPWVGRARWNFGSFYLWGDVPALMPVVKKRVTKTVGHANIRDGHSHTRHLTNQAESDHIKNTGGSWFNIGSPGQKETNRNSVHEAIKGYVPENTKALGRTGLPRILPQIVNKTGSGSKARKAASAMIAKIPFVLSRHIARTYKPA